MSESTNPCVGNWRLTSWDGGGVLNGFLAAGDALSISDSGFVTVTQDGVIRTSQLSLGSDDVTGSYSVHGVPFDVTIAPLPSALGVIRGELCQLDTAGGSEPQGLTTPPTGTFMAQATAGPGDGNGDGLVATAPVHATS